VRVTETFGQGISTGLRQRSQIFEPGAVGAAGVVLLHERLLAENGFSLEVSY
jgi:hypothetical protein